MPKTYYNDNADLSFFDGGSFRIVGYGSQGHAHALSLRNSGYKVTVADVPSSAVRKAAESAGFEVAGRWFQFIPIYRRRLKRPIDHPPTIKLPV